MPFVGLLAASGALTGVVRAPGQRVCFFRSMSF